MQITKRIELPKLMKHLGLPMIAVELGCAEGYSAKDFLEAGVEHLYMVDTWEKIPGQFGDGSNPQSWHDKNYVDAMMRTNIPGKTVTVLRGFTTEMASEIPDGTVGLGYVDACHTYECVKADIESYWSKLVPGGIMAFHDYENETYGVKKAVQEFAKENNLEIYLLPETKKEDAGAYIIKPLNS